MTQYHYHAVDEHGETSVGTMEEQSAHRVTMKLQERGFTVNSVTELNKEQGLARLSNRLTWEELDFLSHELCALTKSNLPLPEAIRALARDAHKPRLKKVLETLGKNLEKGDSLDSALERMQGEVPPLFAHIVRAGEQANNVPGVLQLLSGYTRQIVTLRQNVFLALAYPVASLLAGSLVVLLILVKVVPVFAEIFGEMRAELPAPTQTLIWISNVVTQHTGTALSVIGGSIAGIMIAYMLLRRSETGRRRLDWMRLHVPFAGIMYRLNVLVRFCQTLRILLMSGVPLPYSLELAAAASGSAMLNQIAGDVSAQVASGESLSKAMETSSFFGRDLCWLVSSGEANGMLEDSLEHAGEKYARELDVKNRGWLTLANPLFMLLIGFVIAYMVISLYLPIFTLGDAISGS